MLVKQIRPKGREAVTEWKVEHKGLMWRSFQLMKLVQSRTYAVGFRVKREAARVIKCLLPLES
jgi:hypothetical protein